jgi:Putative lumazine-binding
MKQILIFLTPLFFMSSSVISQSAEDSVKTVIGQLFSAMKGADAKALKETFADSAVLQTIRRNKDGTFSVENENVNDFIEFVGKGKKDSADERISYETIKIDGPLASVWTPYNFYFNGKFSHCGVNSFQLVQINGRWKIQYLIDTRRRQGCE